MGIKENIQKKIEKNAVMSLLSWTDKDGTVHTEKVLLKRSKVPLVGDWGRIYPPLNEDGSLNWMNFIFGGKKNFLKLLFIFGVIAIVGLGFNEVFSYIDYLHSDLCIQQCLENIASQPLYPK